MTIPLAACAAALLAGAGAAAPAAVPATPKVAPAPTGTCAAIYTGSARGTFRCRVVAEHHAAVGVSRLVVEVEGSPVGDALAVTPGGIEWSGPMAPGNHSAADANVPLAWSRLETGQPGLSFDYVASKGWASHPATKGEVAVTVTRAAAGPAAGGVQRFEVHGTFSARLVPAMPGAVSTGAVRIQVTF